MFSNKNWGVPPQTAQVSRIFFRGSGVTSESNCWGLAAQFDPLLKVLPCCPSWTPDCHVIESGHHGATKSTKATGPLAELLEWNADWICMYYMIICILYWMHWTNTYMYVELHIIIYIYINMSALYQSFCCSCCGCVGGCDRRSSFGSGCGFVGLLLWSLLLFHLVSDMK